MLKYNQQLTGECSWDTFLQTDADEGRHLVRLFAKCVSVARKCRTGWSFIQKDLKKTQWFECLQNVSRSGNAEQVDGCSRSDLTDWLSTAELEVTLKKSGLTQGSTGFTRSMFTGFTHVGACLAPSGCSCSLVLYSRILNYHVPPSVCWRIGGFRNRRTDWVKYLANRSASSIELFTSMRWAASCS